MSSDQNPYLPPNAYIGDGVSEVEEKKRPLSLTILCVIGFVGAIFVIPLALSNAARNIGNWYPPFLALSGLVGGACLVGLWRMKRWAVYTYIAMCFINQASMLYMNIWKPGAILLPAIVIFFSLKHLRKMT